jgi:hypothetical protein
MGELEEMFLSRIQSAQISCNGGVLVAVNMRLTITS